jgi:hypothetical protein
MVRERVFGVRCRVCREWMYPMPVKGFSDRVRFICPNNPYHKPLIKLTRNIGKKKLSRYEKKTKEFVRLHTIFLEMLSCYLRFQEENGEDFDAETDRLWKKRCRYCPKQMKRFCSELEILNQVLCTNRRKK